MNLCKVCGKPPRTRPTELLPKGRIIEGAVRCETCPGPAEQPAAERRKRGAVAQAVIAHLREHGEASAQEIVAAGAGAKSAVYSSIGSLAASGAITSRYARHGSERLWSIPA